MNKKKYSLLIIIGGFVIVILLPSIEHLYLKPKEYILKSDKDEINQRMKLMEEKLSKESYESLLIHLLDTTNMDVLSTEKVAQYASKHECCFLLPALKSKFNYLMSLPKDTIWIYQYRWFKERSGNVDFDNSYIKELKFSIDYLSLTCDSVMYENNTK